MIFGLNEKSPFAPWMRLKKLRERRGLSQEKLAELCQFNRHCIGRIERAEQVISFEFMMRIACALAVKPAELYKLIPLPKRMPKKGEKNLKSVNS